MITWSTDHLPLQDRFEYWREERARRLFGVEAEIEPERRLGFEGRIATTVVGPATVAEVAVTTYTMARTQRVIDRAPDASLYVRHIMRGGGLTIAGDSEERVRGGTVSSGLSDVPYTCRPDASLTDSGAVHYRAVRIPLHLLPELPAAPARAGERQHRGASGLDALLRGFLISFLDEAPRLDGPAAAQAVQTLAQLALAARGAFDGRDEPGRAALDHGLLARARAFVDRDLHRADLTPARAAAALGVSVRKLHMLFEPTGESFARHVAARRLARADRLLATEPGLPITQVAYDSGFDSLSTFFRRYRAAFGASPGERRADLRGRDPE